MAWAGTKVVRLLFSLSQTHHERKKKTSVSLTSDDMHLAPDEFQGLVL
jgi:hypothetical protein